MSALILVLSLAFAGEAPVAESLAAELTTLGLEAPTASERAPDWRTSLPGGGIVRGLQAESEEQAAAQFAWWKTTAQAGVWPEADPKALGVDEAAGDGTVSLLVRKGAVVLYVRDLEDHAGAWVERILPVLER